MENLSVLTIECVPHNMMPEKTEMNHAIACLKLQEIRTEATWLMIWTWLSFLTCYIRKALMRQAQATVEFIGGP